MFKFIRKLFLVCLLFIVFLVGGIMFIQHRNYSKLIKNIDTVSNDSSNFTDGLDSISGLKNINDTVSISQVMSNIISNDNYYNLLVKCSDISSLISFDENTKESSIVYLDNDINFNDLSNKVDKYINFDCNSGYSFSDLKNLKSDFLSGDISKKFSIVNNLINNSDTNLKESDFIDLYFTYISKNN